MLPSLMKFGILIDFTINQDFIAKVLCINKDEPDLGCNGKCHLKKKLKEVSKPDSEQQAPNPKNNRLEIVDNYIQMDCCNLSFKKVYETRQASEHRDLLYFNSFTVEIFHPPQSSFIYS